MLEERKDRKLVIQNITTGDEGTYSCRIQDKRSDAKLFVSRWWRIAKLAINLFM